MAYCEQIKKVYKRIAPHIKKTPILTSPYFSQKTRNTILFKCENLQYTNAFKVRGAFSKITNMPDKQKMLITASAGNHGLAIAYAAKKFAMQAIVVVPEFVPQFRIDKIKALGAEVIIHGSTMDELNAKVSEYTKDSNCIYVHGFDDDDIIAGQATITHELLQEVPDIEVIIVPVGGGGLIAGIAQYAKSFNPNILVYGAETIGADAMSKSLIADRLIELPKITSVAISLGATKVAERTFSIVKRNVEAVLTVRDDEAIRELKEILEQDKLFVEPASSCALSLIVSGKLPHLHDKKIAVILSGGNFSLEQLKSL